MHISVQHDFSEPHLQLCQFHHYYRSLLSCPYPDLTQHGDGQCRAPQPQPCHATGSRTTDRCYHGDTTTGETDPAPVQHAADTADLTADAGYAGTTTHPQGSAAAADHADAAPATTATTAAPPTAAAAAADAYEQSYSAWREAWVWAAAAFRHGTTETQDARSHKCSCSVAHVQHGSYGTRQHRFHVGGSRPDVPATDARTIPRATDFPPETSLPVYTHIFTAENTTFPGECGLYCLVSQSFYSV